MLRLRTTYAVAAALWVSAAARPGLADDDLGALVQEGLAGNRELVSLEAQVAALGHAVRQAGAWMNPRLTLSYQNVPVETLALGEEPMSMVLIRLDQPIPLPGKLGRREAVASAAESAKRFGLEERRNALAASIKEAYYRLTLARELEKLTREHIALVEQLIDAVRIKYEVGRTSQQNLLRLEILHDRLNDDAEDLGRTQAALVAALNASLHREVDHPITTPETLDVAAPTLDVATLLGRAKAERPALRALEATAAMHEAQARAAHAELLPDPSLFVAYGVRKSLPTGAGGRDLVTAGISLPLPLFFASREGSMSDQAMAQARASRADYDAALDSLGAALTDAMTRWRREAKRLRAYRDEVRPKAHQALDVTFSSYQVDRADFTSLYDAELELLNDEKTIRTSAAEALIAKARVEALVGEELP